MIQPPSSKSGKLLYTLLPQLYRERDQASPLPQLDSNAMTRRSVRRGDLAEYLDVFGVMLDQVENTLLQRLRDCSPDTCQPWLIPYFADLLDVRLASPDIEGQRKEVARAVAWRKAKGTLDCIAEIATEVGRYQIEVSEGAASTVTLQEGWKRVGTTVTVGRSIPSPMLLGQAPFRDAETGADHVSPITCAKRLGLPQGTVDVRCPARAREVSSPTPASRRNAFGDRVICWQQENRTGAPLYPGSYQDVSVRTVDVRAPSWRHGHYHPSRALLYTSPRGGFFLPIYRDVTWSDLVSWIDAVDRIEHPFCELRKVDDLWMQDRGKAIVSGAQSIAVIDKHFFTHDEHELIRRERIVGVIADESAADTASGSRTERVEQAVFRLTHGYRIVDTYDTPDQHTCSCRITVTGFGTVLPRLVDDDASSVPKTLTTLFGTASYQEVSALCLESFVAEMDVETTRVGTSMESISFHKSVFLGNVDTESRRLEIDESAVLSLKTRECSTEDNSETDSTLVFENSLFEDIAITDDRTCRLVYCTVLGIIDAASIEASDAIISGVDRQRLEQLYLRYSAAPWLNDDETPALLGRVFETVTREKPVFLNETFGEPGCGVLHPVTSEAIRCGSEDGGELGAYHHRHYARREQAVLEKLAHFLPVTITPVLIPHQSWKAPLSPKS